MKKIFSIFLMSYVATIAMAQDFDNDYSLQPAISPDLSGTGSYKGYVEAGYAHTLGKYNGDFIEISTTQGYQFNNWFFMGGGVGFDLLLSHKGTDWGSKLTTQPADMKGYTTTSPMIPIFADFRFLIGDTSNITFYLGLKVGCSFQLTDKLIAINQGYLTNREYFFLNPSLGVRVPCNKKNPKQAFDVGVKYKLLTSNYWENINNNITLQAIGAFIAFEW